MCRHNQLFTFIFSCLLTLLLFQQRIDGKDTPTIRQLQQLGIKSWFTTDELVLLRRKRIRREIRDLTPEEWTKISTAMNIMKYTSLSDGRLQYGLKYWSYDDLVCYHGRTAYSYAGDMGHGPPHFGMWHRAFMLMFEESLLSVDNTIEAFPYWDYRLDSDNPSESVIFSNQYIGSLMGDINNNYAIKDGPFAYWPISDALTLDNVEINNNECSEMSNVFGLMRTRVNPNPSKFVTRIGESFCGNSVNNIGVNDAWDSCLSESDFVEFVKCYETEVHTGAHKGVGGTTPRIIETSSNSDDDDDDISFSCFNWMTATQIQAENHKIFKFYGHMQFSCFDCPSCSLDDTIDMDTCVCSPTGDSCSITDSESTRYTADDLLSKESIHIWGDMLDAVTSVNDPIFFFHHFNMDRYTFIWQLNNFDNAPYYGYPTSGYEYGLNLNDIASPQVPLTNLFDSINGIDKRTDEALTYKEIFDATTFVNAPYIYDDLWYALFGPDYTITDTKSVDQSSDDDDDSSSSSASIAQSVMIGCGIFVTVIMVVIALGFCKFYGCGGGRNDESSRNRNRPRYYGSVVVDVAVPP